MRKNTNSRHVRFWRVSYKEICRFFVADFFIYRVYLK